ncbi:hypothetical protein [Flavisolibacter nicotianae]|uniref:hypothetical protein n=1 Tax=Flavisolibacter nicotianae TaxID=2364882 RepID=UPI000EB4ECE3|nr:hypothetical protein [Flavisolibacter nicotianae]
MIVQMEDQFKKLENADLKALYEKQLQALSDALISGAEWKDVQDQRNLLIEISKRLHRGNSSSSPADYPNRGE